MACRQASGWEDFPILNELGTGQWWGQISLHGVPMTVAFEYLPFCSIVAYAHHEAWTHMFCRNVSAKTDLGTKTYREWFDHYWTVFCHHRWIQHLYGERPFPEFKQGSYFGRIRLTGEGEVWAGQTKLCLTAVKYIEEKFLLLDKPWENLDFVRRQDEIRASGIDYDEVSKVLTQFGINECRLDWAELFVVDECQARDEFRWQMDKLNRMQSA